jgi:hypothetical protein
MQPVDEHVNTERRFSSTLSLQKPKSPSNTSTISTISTSSVVSTRPVSQRKSMTPHVANIPPAPLIETWVWMWQSGSTPQIKAAGKNNLVNAFGSISKVIAFIEQS